MATHSTQPHTSSSRRLTLADDWLAWPGIHGGHLMAVSARTAAGMSGQLPLRAMNARFLRATEPGSVVASAVLVQTSRTTVTVSVQLVQHGHTVMSSICTFAAPSGALSFEGRPPPAVPGPGGREVFRDAELLFPFAKKVEIRPATGVLPLAGADHAELTAWLRLRDAEHGLESLLILADAMPPAIYATLTSPIPVPSMEITVHVAEPVPSNTIFAGWLMAQQRNVRTSGGMSIDECDLWDERGRLVVQTRQLRRVVESDRHALEN